MQRMLDLFGWVGATRGELRDEGSENSLLGLAAQVAVGVGEWVLVLLAILLTLIFTVSISKHFAKGFREGWHRSRA